MSDIHLDKISKLNGSNYRLWVDQIKNVLMMSQRWMVVSGMETCPPNLLPSLVTPLARSSRSGRRIGRSIWGG